MRFLALVLLCVACTQVEKNLVAPPPTLADLEGHYSVAWHGPEILGVGELVGDLSVHFTGYPCLTPGAQEAVGGSFEYEETSGLFVAELKTLDGSTKLVVSGRFRDPESPDLEGTFQVLIDGIECTSGVLEMHRD